MEACEEPAEGTLQITLKADPTSTPSCGGCGRPSPLIHDWQWRRVRDRDLLDRRLWLRIPLRRVDCLHSGRRRERVSWLAPRARFTRRLQAWVEALVQMLPIRHVTALLGLHRTTIKDIDLVGPVADLRRGVSGVERFGKTSLDVAQRVVHTIEAGYRVRRKRALLNSLLEDLLHAAHEWFPFACADAPECHQQAFLYVVHRERRGDEGRYIDVCANWAAPGGQPFERDIAGDGQLHQIVDGWRGAGR
jgi:hypothetical protein